MDENPYKAPAEASDRELLAAREDEAELRISPVLALGGLAALALLSGAVMLALANPSPTNPSPPQRQVAPLAEEPKPTDSQPD